MNNRVWITQGIKIYVPFIFMCMFTSSHTMLHVRRVLRAHVQGVRTPGVPASTCSLGEQSIVLKKTSELLRGLIANYKKTTDFQELIQPTQVARDQLVLLTYDELANQGKNKAKLTDASWKLLHERSFDPEYCADIAGDTFMHKAIKLARMRQQCLLGESKK